MSCMMVQALCAEGNASLRRGWFHHASAANPMSSCVPKGESCTGSAALSASLVPLPPPPRWQWRGARTGRPVRTVRPVLAPLRVAPSRFFSLRLFPAAGASAAPPCSFIFRICSGKSAVGINRTLIEKIFLFKHAGVGVCWVRKGRPASFGDPEAAAPMPRKAKQKNTHSQQTFGHEADNSTRFGSCRATVPGTGGGTPHPRGERRQ